MSVSTQTIQRTTTSVTVSAAQNHKITNMVIDAPKVDVEQSLVLQTNLKQVIIRNRDIGKIQYTFVSGESNTKFITIPKKATRSIINLDFSKTLYLQTDAVSTIEIEEFY